MALRFAATLVFVPLLCVVWSVVAVVLFVVGLFADAMAAVGEGFERGCVRFPGDALGGIARLGAWCVSWPELRPTDAQVRLWWPAASRVD
ncbi:hypothetical protein ACIQ1J_00280 [Streptomyces sp. NPDC097107]|uniref:hypothetical protein n=1 Tax=Streptomyces sp. NPDC097107 TaxID=3366089 RepID=UPI00382E7CF0